MWNAFEFYLFVAGNVEVAASGVILSRSSSCLWNRLRSGITANHIEIAAGGLIFGTFLWGCNGITLLRDVEVATGGIIFSTLLRCGRNVTLVCNVEVATG